jgi:FtsZ-interacting cell division protein YlmF
MKERMRKALGFLGLIEDEYGEYATSVPTRPFTDQPEYDGEPEWSPPPTSSGARPFPTTTSATGPVRPSAPLPQRPTPISVIDGQNQPGRMRPMPSNRIRTLAPQSHDQEVALFFPTEYNESRRLTDLLRSNRAVVLNVSDLDAETGRRVVDFASGTIYALNAKIERLAQGVYLVLPQGTHVGSETKDRLRASNFRSLDNA